MALQLKIKEVFLDYIRYRIIFFQHEGNNYKPVRIGNLWSNNYIEYEGKSDRNKTLLSEEYINKIRPY